MGHLIALWKLFCVSLGLSCPVQLHRLLYNVFTGVSFFSGSSRFHECVVSSRDRAGKLG